MKKRIGFVVNETCQVFFIDNQRTDLFYSNKRAKIRQTAILKPRERGREKNTYSRKI